MVEWSWRRWVSDRLWVLEFEMCWVDLVVVVKLHVDRSWETLADSEVYCALIQVLEMQVSPLRKSLRVS